MNIIRIIATFVFLFLIAITAIPLAVVFLLMYPCLSTQAKKIFKMSISTVNFDVIYLLKDIENVED